MSDLVLSWVIRDPSRVGWFAQALRDAMDQHDVSVMSLSRRMETSPSLVRKWRAGTSVPSVERAADIASAIGVPLADLVATSRGVGGDRRVDPLVLGAADADSEGLPPASASPGLGIAAPSRA